MRAPASKHSNHHERTTSLTVPPHNNTQLAVSRTNSPLSAVTPTGGYTLPDRALASLGLAFDSLIDAAEAIAARAWERDSRPFAANALRAKRLAHLTHELAEIVAGEVVA